MAKSIEKRNSLSVSRINNSNNCDKLRMRKNRIKLFILKRLSETRINNDGKLLMVANDGEFEMFKVKSNMREAKDDLVWRHINQCSRFNAEWENIFA